MFSGNQSSSKVPWYLSKTFDGIFYLFYTLCRTPCQKHNIFSVNICWTWKGGKRWEEIKRRKIRVRERNWEWMNQLVYAREEAAILYPKEGRSRQLNLGKYQIPPLVALRSWISRFEIWPCKDIQAFPFVLKCVVTQGLRPMGDATDTKESNLSSYKLNINATSPTSPPV